MNPVVHFEMPFDDRDRMARFYETAFGWQTQKFGPEMGHYVTAATSPSGADGRPLAPGHINGGFFPRQLDGPTQGPTQGPSVVLAVDAIQAAMGRLVAAGGSLLGEPVDIPGVGRYVSFADTENSRVSLLQPLPRA